MPAPLDALLRATPHRFRPPFERSVLAAMRFLPPFGPLASPEAAGAEATLVALGDLALTGSAALEHPARVLGALGGLLAEADLRLGNVEAVLSDRGGKVPSGVALRAAPQAVAALTAARLDVVTCANNHILDYGPDAAADSCRRLREVGIDVVGYGDDASEARAPVVRRVGAAGVRVAVLGYADDHVVRPEFGDAGPAPTDDEAVIADITAARGVADVVVLQLHWGYEWVLHPLRSLRDRARRFADAGADLVICHHAHVPMGLESWGRSVIAHGLGNAYFRYNPHAAHPWRNRGLALRIGLSRGGVTGAEVVPIGIFPDESVRPLDGVARREVLGALGRMTARLHDDAYLQEVEVGRLAFETSALFARLARPDAAAARAIACFLQAPRQRALRRALLVLDDGAWRDSAHALDELADAWDAPTRVPAAARAAAALAPDTRRLAARHRVGRGLAGRLP